MSNCVTSNYKSYADNLQLQTRCKECKQRFEPLNYKQRFCRDYQCRQLRRKKQQRAYCQKRVESAKELEA